MSKKRVYAALELADGEVRLAVMEVYEGRANVLRRQPGFPERQSRTKPVSWRPYARR